jgi:hypothetical protein
MMGDERYKFKWSNIDLDDFVEQRKFASKQLRADARLLMVRADQIDEEIIEWKMALEVPGDE